MKQEYDGIRQAYLESLGLVIFRITDFDVRYNLSVVMKELEDFIVWKYGNHPVFKNLVIFESTPPEEGNFYRLVALYFLI